MADCVVYATSMLSCISLRLFRNEKVRGSTPLGSTIQLVQECLSPLTQNTSLPAGFIQHFRKMFTAVR